MIDERSEKRVEMSPRQVATIAWIEADDRFECRVVEDDPDTRFVRLEGLYVEEGPSEGDPAWLDTDGLIRKQLDSDESTHPSTLPAFTGGNAVAPTPEPTA